MINTAKLDSMINGWFIGSFQPSAFNTNACEVAVKHYKAGDAEKEHYHKIATEITLILYGTVYMAKKEWKAGDIIVLSPGEITNFKALTDSVTVVVKIPGSLNDKYIIDDDISNKL